MDELRLRFRCAALAVAVLFVPTGDTAAVQPPITALAFAPSGDSLVAASQAGVTLYSWPDLQRQRTIELELANIHDLAFSPDGTRLAVAGGDPAVRGAVRVYDWPSLESSRLYGDHQDSVLAVAWKDSLTLATAGLDRQLVVWSLDEPQPQLRLVGHSGGIAALALLGDGSCWISGGLDQNIRVWDSGSGELLRTLNNHTREVQALAVRPGEGEPPMLASASADKTIRLWQPTIGRMVRFNRLDATPLAVAWTAGGTRLAVACDDGRLRLLDPESVAVIRDLPVLEGWAHAVAAHSTDGSLAIGGYDGQVRRVVLESPAQPRP